jgi:hypothetical protein
VRTGSHGTLVVFLSDSDIGGDDGGGICETPDDLALRARKTCKCRPFPPFRERLKGFEPSTFCMASRAWGYADSLYIPANQRVHCPRAAADDPALHREITGVRGLKAD